MNGEFRVVDDVAASFASLVCEQFGASTVERFTIALSGGSTATSCYTQLSKQELDWSSVVAVWGDERMVPLDHEDSNYQLAKNALFDNVSPLASVHPMGGDTTADEYNELIESLSPIDVVHLGVGDDGHIASLFPGVDDALNERNRMVIETGDDLHKHRRLSFTYTPIDRAKLVVLTITGERKRDMVEQLRNGFDYPANRIKARNAVWLVDQAAAG